MASKLSRQGAVSAAIAVLVVLGGTSAPRISDATLITPARLVSGISHALSSANGAPPALPAALPPAPPTVAATSVGYLPESWNVTPTGQFVDSIPLAVPPGRSGMQPSLALSYSSDGGDGLLGVGWSMNYGSRITRCGKSLDTEGVVDGVHFIDGPDGDRFCLDGEKLVAVGVDQSAGQYGGSDTEYRTEFESFTRIVSKDADSKGPLTFEVHTRDGHTMKYEPVTATRVKGDGTIVGDVRTEWLIKSNTDLAGNAITYEWLVEQNSGPSVTDHQLEVRPYRINYTSNASQQAPAYRYVEFSYEGRPDHTLTWDSGVQHAQTWRIKSIDMYAPNPANTAMVWQYKFSYATSSGSNRSLLTSVQECSTAGGCAWKKQFDWNPTSKVPLFETPQLRSAPLMEVTHDPLETVEDPALQVLDLNGDGATDVVLHPGSALDDFTISSNVWTSKRDAATGEMIALGDGPVHVARDGIPTDPYSHIQAGSGYPIDLDGDGKDELVVQSSYTEPFYYVDDKTQISSVLYYHNCSRRVERWNEATKSFEVTAGLEGCELAGYRPQPEGFPLYVPEKLVFADLNGDGLPDAIVGKQPDDKPVDEITPYHPEWNVRFNNDQGQPGVFGQSQHLTTLDQFNQPKGLSAQCTVRVTDIEGNGHADVVTKDTYIGLQNKLQCGGGTANKAITSTIDYQANAQVLTSGSPISFPSGGLAEDAAGESNIRFGDFNGDGLEDYVTINYGTYVNGHHSDTPTAVGTINWNTGNGYYPDSHQFTLPLDMHPDQSNHVDTLFSDRGIRVVDINHDGRADLIVFRNDPSPVLTMLLSKGDGTFDRVDMPLSSAGTRLDAKVTTFKSGMFWRHVPDEDIGSVFLSVLATDLTILDVPFPANLTIDYEQPWSSIPEAFHNDPSADAGLAPGWSLAQVGDFNADGFPDLIRHVGSENGSLEIMQQAPDLGDRIIAIYDEPTVWPREEITYSTEWSDYPAGKMNYSCSYPLHCIRSGLIVVRSVTSRTNLVDPNDVTVSSGGRTLHYAYEDPISDMRGRGFLGFGEFRVWDPVQPTETITRFDHRKSQTGYWPHANRMYYPGAGVPSSVMTVSPILNPDQGQPTTATARVTIHRNYYGNYFFNFYNDNNETSAVLPQSWTSDTWDQAVSISWWAPSSGPTHRHIEGVQDVYNADIHAEGQTTDYDNYGNLLSSHVVVKNGTGLHATTTYENRVDNGTWLLGLPKKQTVMSAELYNNPPAVTRTTEYHYNALGLPDTIWVEKGNANPDIPSTTTLAYNGYGQLISSTTTVANEPPRTSHIEYKQLKNAWPDNWPDESLFASQIWAEHDNPVCPPGIDCRPSAWVVTDPAYGSPLITMDVNGVTATTQHDGLGRPVMSKADGELPVTFSYNGRNDQFGGQNGMEIATSIELQTQTTQTDARGLTLHSEKVGFDLQSTIAHDAQYDMLGRLVQASRPYDPYQGVAADWTKYSYDSLNRLLSVTAPDSTKVTHDYPTMFKTMTTDARGNTSYTVVDYDGRLVSSVNEWVGPPPAPGIPPLEVDIKTTYTYAPFGLVNTVTDDQGHVTQTLYDVRGRPIQSNDPSTGTTTLAYNGFGELRQEIRKGITGQDSKTATQVHDDLGRVVSATNTNSGMDGTATITYDTSPHGVGQIASSKSIEGIETDYRYDGLGRAAGVDLIDEQNTHYGIDLSYDPQTGRLTSMMYPSVPGRSRFTAKYTYNAIGMLTEVGDASSGQPYQPLWHVDRRNLDLALTDGSLGNGAIKLHRDYDTVMGRLSVMSASNAATNLLSTGYQYWPNGLVKQRITDDGVMQRDEGFDYDALNRLTHWDLGYRNSSLVLNPPPYTSAPATDYVYDTIGNLTDIKNAGQVVEHRTYGKNGSQPHTLTDLQKLPANTHTTYQYDAFGRMYQDDTGRTISFNEFDLPTSMTKGSTTWNLLYDAAGQRIKKIGTDGTTFYFPGLYERRQMGNSVKHVFHVSGTDGAVAEIEYDEGAGTSVLYPLTDALGSTSAVADANGTLTERNYYDPFGQRINADGTLAGASNSPVKEGFTGQEHDDAFGLINFQGRMYDPAMKRFLSVDPIVAAPAFGQSWNPYSYVNNNPLNNIDPTGFKGVPCSSAVSTDGGKTWAGGSSGLCNPDTGAPNPPSGYSSAGLSQNVNTSRSGPDGSNAKNGVGSDSGAFAPGSMPTMNKADDSPSITTSNDPADRTPGQLMREYVNHAGYDSWYDLYFARQEFKSKGEWYNLFHDFPGQKLEWTSGFRERLGSQAEDIGLKESMRNLNILVGDGVFAYPPVNAQPTARVVPAFEDAGGEEIDAAAVAARAATAGGDRIFYVAPNGAAQAARFTSTGVTFDTVNNSLVTQMATDEWLARNPTESIVALTGFHSEALSTTSGEPNFMVPSGTFSEELAPNHLAPMARGGARFPEVGPTIYRFAQPNRVIIMDGHDIGGVSRLPETVSDLRDNGIATCLDWCMSTFGQSN